MALKKVTNTEKPKMKNIKTMIKMKKELVAKCESGTGGFEPQLSTVKIKRTTPLDQSPDVFMEGD